MKYRLIGLLLFCVTLVMVSCTKKEEKPQTEETAADFRYSDTRMLFPFPEDANRVLDRLYVTDGKIGLVYQPLAMEEKSPDDEKSEWTVDFDTGEVMKKSGGYPEMRVSETILWQFDPETGETVSTVLYPEEDGYIPNSSLPMIFGDLGSVSRGTDHSAVEYIPNDRHLLCYAPDGSREKTVSVAAVYPGGLPMDAYDYSVLSGQEIIWLYDSVKKTLLAFERDGNLLGTAMLPKEWKEPEFLLSGGGTVIVRYQMQKNGQMFYGYASVDDETLSVTPLDVPETGDENVCFDTELRMYAGGEHIGKRKRHDR